MKKILITLSLFFAIGSLFAQDLVITSSGDTLNCKITSDKGEYLRFNYMNGDDYRKTLISKSDVVRYDYDYFSEAEIPEGIKQRTNHYQPFRLSLNGGGAYRIGRISSDYITELRDYMKELKWGSQFSADATWFISESVGFGLKFNHYMSSNSIANVSADVNHDGITEYGNMSDDIGITFFGPMVSTVSYSANRSNAFFGNFGLGYLGYHDEGELAGSSIELDGSTVGIVGDLGYQVGLSENFSLAFTLGYTLGILTKVDQTIQGQTHTYDLDDDNQENLGRIDLSVGLVFHK